VFCSFLMSMMLWSLFIFFMRVSPDTHRALGWERAAVVPVLAAFVFYYHFTLVSTNTRGQRKILLVSYLLLVVFACLAPTNLVIQEMRVEDYGYAPIVAPVSYMWFLIGPLLTIGGAYNLFKRYRISASHEERNRLAYLTIAVVFPLIGAALDGFTNLPPAAIWCNLMFCIICTVAIMRYRLLDITIVIRKGVAYVLMSTIVAVPYVSIIILFNNLAGTNNISMWGYPVLLVFLALLLQPLWQIVQRLVDRMFYRERYDFLKELEYFSQEAHDISNLEQLGSSLVKLVKRALQISNVHLLLRSETGGFSVTFSTGDSTAELALKRDSPLLRWLQLNKGLLHRQDLDVIPQLQSLSAKERNELRKIEAELFVPLRTNKDELVGILVLGKKLSHQLYSEEDKSLISTVASRVAIELENARLYTLETTMRQELEKQDAQKTEFLHSVAHELKTPLTAIISSSELMSTDGLTATPEMRERLIDNINRSAWLMDRRVGELLDLARIRIGNIQLRLEALEISELIDEVASQLSSLFKNKGQPLGLEIQNALPLVNADKERVQQVLLNLLSNANKYSPTGSKIEIRARQENNSVLIAVEDSAAAISEQDRDKIFDPYIRGGDEEERQRIPGLGLGLAICKKIVELHEGEIWVESEVGRGNIFSFSLPIWNGEQVKPDDSSTLSRIGG
jgi:K+-sensing histidine kinase KdpD